jgi:hypothetical protein
MADEQSTEVDQVETEPVETEEVETKEDKDPLDDALLDALKDTEGKEESKDEPADETKDDESTESEAEPEAEQKTEDETDDQPLDPKEEARRRYEERQKVREETRARVAQQSEDYVNEVDDPTEQRLRAIEAQEYGRIIENNQNTLVAEFERAKVNPDLQIFNPDSKEFNQKAYEKTMRDYNAGYLEYDANGNMVGIKGSLYEHLTETAELLTGAVKSGQVQQVRATRKMKTNSDSKPAAPPKETTKDPLMEILLED